MPAKKHLRHLHVRHRPRCARHSPEQTTNDLRPGRPTPPTTAHPGRRPRLTHPPRTRNSAPGRRGTLEPRDRRATRAQQPQDPRQPRPPQAPPPRSGTGRGCRLRVRPRRSTCLAIPLRRRLSEVGLVRVRVSAPRQMSCSRLPQSYAERCVHGVEGPHAHPEQRRDSGGRGQAAQPRAAGDPGHEPGAEQGDRADRG
jgi:hypothetical protein